jgi:hypothetical protein
VGKILPLMHKGAIEIHGAKPDTIQLFPMRDISKPTTLHIAVDTKLRPGELVKEDPDAFGNDLLLYARAMLPSGRSKCELLRIQFKCLQALASLDYVRNILTGMLWGLVESIDANEGDSKLFDATSEPSDEEVTVHNIAMFARDIGCMDQVTEQIREGRRRLVRVDWDAPATATNKTWRVFEDEDTTVTVIPGADFRNATLKSVRSSSDWRSIAFSPAELTYKGSTIKVSPAVVCCSSVPELKDAMKHASLPK